MNSGGEPERDDTGLPPVDTEIPDDARELERDMQAYHRELRARQRYRRQARLRSTLSRDGIVVPVLICCLVSALVAGTLLTLLTATSIDQNLPGTTGSHATRPPARVSAPATSGTGGGSSAPVAKPVPLLKGAPAAVADARFTVGGKTTELRLLRSAVLIVVPPRCACDAAILRLASLARSARASTYVAVTPGMAGLDTRTYDQLRGKEAAAVDQSGTLRALHTSGLSAVLVSAGGVVRYADMLQDSKRLTAIVRAAHV